MVPKAPLGHAEILTKSPTFTIISPVIAGRHPSVVVLGHTPATVRRNMTGSAIVVRTVLQPIALMGRRMVTKVTHIEVVRNWNALSISCKEIWNRCAGS